MLCSHWFHKDKGNTKKTPRFQILTFPLAGVTTAFTIGEDVPANVRGFVVKGWGAGGAGALGDSIFGGSGGGGAYFLVSGLTTRRNGKQYKITVGAGGVPGQAAGKGGDTIFEAVDGSFAVRAGGGQGGVASLAGGNGGVATVTQSSPDVEVTLLAGTAGSSGGSTAGIGGSSSFGGVGGSQGFTDEPGNLPSIPGGGGAGASSTYSLPAQNGAAGFLQIEYIEA